jgi:hypothetical protein
MNNLTIGESMRVQGGTFTIGRSVVVGGNLTVQNLPAGSAQNRVFGVTINGNLRLQNNDAPALIGATAPVLCAGNAVRGDVFARNNTAAASVVGNTISDNLIAQDNTAATNLENNTVQRQLLCQNNTSITGGGNTAAHKQGQCAGF